MAALFSGAITLCQIAFLRETYAPTLLRRRAAALSKATGQVYLSKNDIAKPLDTKALMKRQFRVPFRLLFTEPIVFFCSL